MYLDFEFELIWPISGGQALSGGPIAPLKNPGFRELCGDVCSHIILHTPTVHVIVSKALSLFRTVKIRTFMYFNHSGCFSTCPPKMHPLSLQYMCISALCHFRCGLPSQDWVLLYRGSRDGFHARNFHSCCDEKGATVVLVKVSRSW